jgi:hypothetical protein
MRPGGNHVMVSPATTGDDWRCHASGTECLANIRLVYGTNFDSLVVKKVDGARQEATIAEIQTETVPEDDA